MCSATIFSSCLRIQKAKTFAKYSLKFRIAWGLRKLIPPASKLYRDSVSSGKPRVNWRKCPNSWGREPMFSARR